MEFPEEYGYYLEQHILAINIHLIEAQHWRQKLVTTKKLCFGILSLYLGPQWIERPPGVREVMGSIPVGDQNFSLSHARVMLSNSPSHFITELKIHHLC